MNPRRKKGLLRRAVAAAFWGGLLVAAGFGVVHFRGGPSAGGGLVAGSVAATLPAVTKAPAPSPAAAKAASGLPELAAAPQRKAPSAASKARTALLR